MTVSSVSIRSMSGKLTSKGPEYSVVRQFKMTSSSDGPNVIFNYLLTSGPFIGSSYSAGNDSDPTAFCSEIDVPVRSSSAEDIWHVTFTYKTPNSESDNRPTTDPTVMSYLPWNWRPEVSIDWAPHQEPCEKAKYISGFLHAPQVIVPNTEICPVNSTLAEVFDPPLMRDQSRMIIRMKHWDLSYPANLIKPLIDSINSHAVDFESWLLTIYGASIGGLTGDFDAYSLKVATISETPKRESFEISGVRYNVEFFEINTEIHWDKHGWREEVVDRGTLRTANAGDPDGRGGAIYATDVPAGVAITAPILDHDLNPVNHPVLLDGKGLPLDDPTSPKFITYGKYDEIDFSASLFLNILFKPR